jgi:hypothetical protein
MLKFELEIRNYIYELSIARDEIMELYDFPSRYFSQTPWRRDADSFALTQTNRQIRLEFLAMYYSATEFQITLPVLSKFMTTTINKILVASAPARLCIDIPYSGARGSQQASIRGNHALRVVEFARKYPNCQIRFCRNAKSGKPALSDEEKSAWENVLENKSSIYQQWLREKAIHEICINTTGRIRIVIHGHVASALRPRLWLNESHRIETELGFPVNNVRIGVYYG